MPVISQRSFVLAPTTDKYVSLAGEEFTRTIDMTGIPADWSRIRIAINCAIADTGGGNLTNDFLFMGLCHGTTYPFGSQQTVNALGVIFGSTVATWAYNAGAGNPYYSTASFGGTRKSGINYTVSVTGSLNIYVPTPTGTVKRRGWLGANIHQISSTQCAVHPISESSVTVAADVWYEHFIYGTNQVQFPYLLESLADDGGPISFTPGAGWNNNPLNSVDIYWTNTTYPLEIYAIALEITTY